MPLTTDKELSDQSRSLWLKAMSAVELRNFGYAIQLIQTVLKEAPGFLDGRRVLRRAEVANTKGKKQSFISSLSGASLKGGGMVKKDPMAAMELAEKTLESDPYNRQANDLLKDAARAAGFPEVAAFALETLVDGNPKDTKLLHELGEQYTRMGQSDKAVRVYTKITEINPADLQAVKMSKDAAASDTMSKGGWETAKDYRDLIHNKEQAVSMEQDNRTVKDIHMVENQLADFYKRYEAGEHENMEVIRRIAKLQEQKYAITEQAADLEEAVKWYAYCNEVAKGSDPAIARKFSDLEMKRKELEIKQIEDWFAAGGDQHEQAEEYRTHLTRLKQERAEALIGEARKRVERNPTDLQLRFELGERLLDSGNFNDAIPELQQARRHANVRLRAVSLLGRCFVQKGMLDMAANQFESAVSEMTAMDNVKKDTLYDLGLLYEKMNQPEKYINYIKEIAEVDYTYKDVAQRIERFYSGGGQ